MRVKIFSADKPDKLEKMINFWLEKSPVVIEDKGYLIGNGGISIVFLWYMG